MWEFDPEMIHEKYGSVLERLNEERSGIWPLNDTRQIRGQSERGWNQGKATF